MPRGEKATYEKSFNSALRFLSRRGAEAREAHVGRFLSEVKSMPAPSGNGTGKRKKRAGAEATEESASASPAPAKKVKKGKKKSGRAKKAPAATEAATKAEDESADDE